MPVILFHAGFPAFAGGYLGVDVFFVISGYLITGILARDLARGRFSIARFYERRARRILPALAFVLLACVPVALAWLSPPELRDFSASFLATALSVSNFVFWQELDYFGPAAEHLPLLHTWSLGIEEQFYILFPLALAALWRWRPRHPGHARAILAAALALSLAAAAWAAAVHPSAGFFLLPFRAWELLLGALAALAVPPRPSAPLALAGLLAILAAMAAVPLGLLPNVLPMALACAGTALVLLFAARGGGAYRLLASAPFVGIGLVSYSAYLWHQPLLAFARIRFGELPAAAVLALGAAAILLAWPTWAFVERPFRRPAAKAGSGASPRRPLAAAAWTIAGLSALGLAGLLTNGLAAREPLAVRAIRAGVTDFNPMRAACKTGLEDRNPAHPVPACLLDGTAPAVAFTGDSHADALQGAMFELARAAGFRFYSVTRSACPPVPGLTRTPGGNLRCDDFARGVEAYLDAAPFPVVVLAARWTAGLAPTPFDNGEGGVDGRPGDVLAPAAGSPATDADRQRAVLAAYVATVEDLLARGHRVVLVYPIPEAGWNVPEELARRRAAAGHPLTLSTPLAAYEARQAAVTAAFDAIASPHLYRVRPADLLCREIVPGRCVNSIGDQPLYFDDNHLNNTGALLVGERILAAIDAARQDAAAE